MAHQRAAAPHHLLDDHSNSFPNPFLKHKAQYKYQLKE